MEFRCLSYLNKFSDWTCCTKSVSNPDKATASPYHGLQKTEKNQASEAYLSRDVQCPCLAYQSALTPFFTRVLCLVFGHTGQPCHFLSVEESRGEVWCGGWAPLPMLFACISGHGMADNVTIVITVTNGHPGSTERVWRFVMTKKQKLRTGLEVTLIWGPSDSLRIPSELSLGSCCQHAIYLKEKCSPWDGRGLLAVAHSQLIMSLLGYGATQQKQSHHKGHSRIVGHFCQLAFLYFCAWLNSLCQNLPARSRLGMVPHQPHG